MASSSSSRPRDELIARPIIVTDFQRQELATHLNITDIHSLVASFNASKLGSQQRKLLREWLEEYVVLFNSGEASKTSEIRSFSRLANVECHSGEEMDLVRRMFFALCARIGTPRQFPVVLISAVDYALDTISIDIVADMTADVMLLGNELLSKISKYASYTKEMYKKHWTILFAIQRILSKFREMGRGEQSCSICQQLMEKLIEIEQCTDYYPYFFHARLTKKSFRQLGTDILNNCLMMYNRQLFECICGNPTDQRLWALNDLNIAIRGMTVKELAVWNATICRFGISGKLL